MAKSKVTRNTKLTVKEEELEKEVQRLERKYGITRVADVPSGRELAKLLDATRNDMGIKTSEERVIKAVASDLVSEISARQARARYEGAKVLYKRFAEEGMLGKGEKAPTLQQLRYHQKEYTEAIKRYSAELKAKGITGYAMKKEIGREFFGSP